MINLKWMILTLILSGCDHSNIKIKLGDEKPPELPIPSQAVKDEFERSCGGLKCVNLIMYLYELNKFKEEYELYRKEK